MKPLVALVVVLVLILFSGMAVARTDQFGIYTDVYGVQCYLDSPNLLPANNAFYVIHWVSNATASQFKIIDTTGLYFASWSTPYSFQGTWNTDLSLSYGGCTLGSHVVLQLNFMWFGDPVPTGCAHGLTVAAAPTSPLPGEVAVVDCAQPNGNVRPAFAHPLIYSTEWNQCGVWRFYCGVVPVSETTWGGIKAMYR